MRYELNLPLSIYELGQRKNQEDSIYPDFGKATTQDRLFIVCDGMGGHEHGEVASHAVATTIGNFITQSMVDNQPFTDQLLLEAVAEAYQQLDRLDQGEVRKMGTTLTLLCLHRHGATVAHIGDSRIYHLRPTTGEILFISRDHSLVMDLYGAGEITREEMRTSPQKNIITKAMTPGEENHAKPSIVHITDIMDGDFFYLCSDGMLEQMEDEEFLALLGENSTDDEKCKALIRATQGNKDNHSAYLIHVEHVFTEPGDEALQGDELTSRFNAINIYRERETQNAQDVSIAFPPPFHQRDISLATTVTASESNCESKKDIMAGINPKEPAKTKCNHFKTTLFTLIAILVIAAVGLYYHSKTQQETQAPIPVTASPDSTNSTITPNKRCTIGPTQETNKKQKNDSVKVTTTSSNQQEKAKSYDTTSIKTVINRIKRDSEEKKKEKDKAQLDSTGS